MVKKVGHSTIAELEIAGQVAAIVGEPHRDFYASMIAVSRHIGAERLLSFAAEAVVLFEEGAKTTAGNRRRTPGGNLFALLRLAGVPHLHPVSIRKSKTRGPTGRRLKAVLPHLSDAKARKRITDAALTPEEHAIMQEDAKKHAEQQRAHKLARLAKRKAENAAIRREKEATARELALGGMAVEAVAKTVGIGPTTVMRLMQSGPPADPAQQ